VSADLHALAADDTLTPLWAAVHHRLSSGTDPAAIATLKVEGLNRAGVATLRAWLDTTTRRRRTGTAVPVANGTTTVPVRDLLAVLDLEPAHLTALAETAIGRPVVDRSAARRAATDVRTDLWDHAALRLATTPSLVAALRAAGVADHQLDDVRTLVDHLADALDRLPADPPVSLPKLAHDVTGNPHYFDLAADANGQRLVAGIAERHGWTPPARPDLTRRMLADAGVLADRITTTVTLLNVSADGHGPVDRRLNDHSGPTPVSLYDLVVHPPRFAVAMLTVVENPSVLEAALAAGTTMPLACTSGTLTSVDHELLALAASQGVHLRYAGDLDAAGRGIAAAVANHHGAQLVAMGHDLQGAVYQEHDAVLRQLGIVP
jgi:uncharacterized protein (TIGR02679 family)